MAARDGAISERQQEAAAGATQQAHVITSYSIHYTKLYDSVRRRWPISAPTISVCTVPDTKYLVAALLVFVAKGDGRISDEESAEMMGLISDHFGIGSGMQNSSYSPGATAVRSRPSISQIPASSSRRWTAPWSLCIPATER